MIIQLKKYQKEKRYDDKKMGELCGCSRSWYNRAKNGHVVLSADMERTAIKNIPEIRPEVASKGLDTLLAYASLED